MIERWPWLAFEWGVRWTKKQIEIDFYFSSTSFVYIVVVLKQHQRERERKTKSIAVLSLISRYQPRVPAPFIQMSNMCLDFGFIGLTFIISSKIPSTHTHTHPQKRYSLKKLSTISRCSFFFMDLTCHFFFDLYPIFCLLSSEQIRNWMEGRLDRVVEINVDSVRCQSVSRCEWSLYNGLLVFTRQILRNKYFDNFCTLCLRFSLNGGKHETRVKNS